MKIPKKIGYGLLAAGFAGIFSSTGAATYFTYKADSRNERSSAYVRLAQIERESSELKDNLFVDCLPTAYELLSTDCFNKKMRQYFSLQQEKKALMQSDGYKMAEEMKNSYQAHKKEAALISIGMFAPFFAGAIVVYRRKDEKFEERLNRIGAGEKE